MANITQIQSGQCALNEEMNSLFAHAFEDEESYVRKQPSGDYAEKLLNNRSFIALVAWQDEKVGGALAAYELVKFEQERSEIYIYDLAVSLECRKQGIATQLITRLKAIARQRKAWVIFVQADTDEDYLPVIVLYTKLGTKEEVLHFDIEVSDEC